jgi:hypothetical protein
LDPQPCPYCGTALEGRPEFCPSCGNYLDWESSAPTERLPQPGAGAGADETLAQEIVVPVRSRPVHGEHGHASAGAAQVPTLSVAEGDVTVDPGSTGTVVLTVLNAGSQVDEVDLAIDPPVATFATLSPESVHLYPQGKAEITLTFSPPRDPRVPAGRHPWTVRARSRVSLRQASVTGNVEVVPFAAEVAELEPRQTSGWRRHFEHSIALRNDGNAPWSAALQPERSDGLSLQVTPAALTVQPGTWGESTLRGRARRKIIGTGETLPLRVDVMTVGGAGAPRSVGLDASRYQRALLPTWLLTAAVAILGLAIAAYAVFGRSTEEVPTVPAVAGRPAAEAAAVLEAAGYRVTSTSEPSQSTAEGLVLRTSPAEGSPAKEGDSVLLFVSSGPPQGKIQVPAVVRLPADEAEHILTDSGLKVRRVSEPNDTTPEGQVIRTEPAPATEVDVGTGIVVFVSEGPAETPTPTATTPTPTPTFELPEPGFDTVAEPIDPSRSLLTIARIRTASDADFDRFVLDLDGPVNGYEVGYVEPGFLQVRMEGVLAEDLTTDTPLTRVVSVQNEVDPDAATVTLILEVPSGGPFRAFTLGPDADTRRPDRLVVDVFD